MWFYKKEKEMTINLLIVVAKKLSKLSISFKYNQFESSAILVYTVPTKISTYVVLPYAGVLNILEVTFYLGL